VRNALRGPKRLCVLRSVKRKKNVQGGVQDKVGCTTMVSTVRSTLDCYTPLSCVYAGRTWFCTTPTGSTLDRFQIPTDLLRLTIHYTMNTSENLMANPTNYSSLAMISFSSIFFSIRNMSARRSSFVALVPLRALRIISLPILL
jgi:hypothetical protein